MSTRSEDEIDKFRQMADDWWDASGSAKGLHSMNGLRVAMVSEAAGGEGGTLEGLALLQEAPRVRLALIAMLMYYSVVSPAAPKKER